MTLCKRCNGLGVLRVSNEEQQMDSLVYCSCDWAKKQKHLWDIPTVNRKIESAFDVTSCPLAWFLPDNERASVAVGFMVNSMDGKINGWRHRMNEAVEFWVRWGNVFEEQKHHMEGR